MGYAWETYYYFQSHSGSSGLFLNREGSGDIGNNQNVTIFQNTSGNEANSDHLFKIVRAYGVDSRDVVGCSIRSKLNPQYGLNIYGYGSSMTAEGNCDLYPVGGTRPTASNYNDSLIELQTVDSEKMLYKITLIKHPGLYLTPVGQYNNANVRWVKSTQENAHIWKLCTSETPGGSSGGESTRTEITLPSDRTYNWNQFDSSIRQICGDFGCSLTCLLDIANIFGPQSYTADDIKNVCGWNSNGVTSWSIPSSCAGSIYPNGYSGSTSRANALQVAKAEIQNNNPIILKLVKSSTGSTHFVVAYKFINSGSQISDFYVLDPGTGSACTLAEAMSKNGQKDTVYNYIQTKRN